MKSLLVSTVPKSMETPRGGAALAATPWGVLEAPNTHLQGRSGVGGGGLLGFAVLEIWPYLQLVSHRSLALKKSCHQRTGRKPVEISHCGKGFPLVPLLPVRSLTSPLQMFDLPSVA